VIVVRTLRGSLAGVLGSVVFGLMLVVGVAPAFANSGWWHLSEQVRPVVLREGSGRDEVQALTVSANGGEFMLLHFGVPSGVVKFDATDEELRTALEGIYGAGTIEVAGGPGSMAGGTYQVEPIEVDKKAVGGVELTCEGSPCPESVSVREVETSRSDGQIAIIASNVGDAYIDGGVAPVAIEAQLPAGLEAVSMAAVMPKDVSVNGPSCSVTSLRCRFKESLPAFTDIETDVNVVVKPGTNGAEAVRAAVSGGEVRGATVTHQVAIGDESPRFGAENYEMAPEEEGGAADTQAGSHPFQLTTTITLNQTLEAGSPLSPASFPQPVALAKDLHFLLPPGLIGDPTPFPECALGKFLARGNLNAPVENLCPPQTAIGAASVTVAESDYGAATYESPLFVLEPSVGEPARFGFVTAGGVPVYLDTAVRTGGDYGVTVDVSNIAQVVGFLGSEVTFWGVPGDPRHDGQRGWGCFFEDLGKSANSHLPCNSLGAHSPPPLLALPTSCTGPLQTSVEADSWAHEGSFLTTPATAPLPALDGCNRLPFEPSIILTPDGRAGSTPTGLAVTVHVPQTESLNAEGLAEANVKNTMVTLPEGVALNPAAADGLQACPEEGIALHSAEPPTCPEASKIGTVKVKTPLLPNVLEGSAYLAEQNANPFGSLVAMYVYVEDPISGSRVKVAGEVVPNPVTGQLVSTFKETPELPFETFELHFFGGDRAPLATPARCGAYTTTAAVEPWTETGAVDSSSTFDVTSGPNGSACSDPLPFNPTLTVGTSSIQAGGFSPFVMTMSREDGEQPLQGIALHMPKGVSGTLSTVKLCGEQQADEGTCGPESQIGETIVSVGVGGDPYTVRGGKVYITGPYKGAPFGLSIVNPAKAGPYNLGQVIVRAKLEVNEETAAITVTTDDEGPYKIPTILDGIPLQIKHVSVNINRPGFTFNATNCNPLQITGDLVSTEGATSTVPVPYQVTNCAVLAFKPKLEASTSGKTSRTEGASLHVKLGYPAGPYDANIARVKVELPKALPSRLTTLQKACTAQVFEANPAACPAASIVGHATATTPELPVALTGPAYFVSHGGEAFPSLVIVLQGYGVTVHLVGSTFINEKTGVTSSTFKAVPDAPVGSFELTLPTGPYSALGANKNLCKTKLTMPTEFVGQNGALIKTSTKIAVTGCGKTVHRKHRSKHTTGRRRKR